jgi:fermentation-respiration switch protein FrsA (DUF1100 family)
MKRALRWVAVAAAVALCVLCAAAAWLCDNTLHVRRVQAVAPDRAGAPAHASAVARTPTPILLIHGLRDTNIPPEHSRRIAARNSAIQVWWVPGAAHTEAQSRAPQEFERRVTAWFAAHR